MKNARLIKIKKGKFNQLEKEIDKTIKEKNYQRLRQFVVQKIDNEIINYKWQGKYEINEIVETLIRTLVFIESNRKMKGGTQNGI
jgi:hypothetical protein